MTDKELQKLKRADLLEILVEQGKEIERLRAEIETLQKKLNDRTICIDKAGTIAEASFQLNGIFEAAHAASAQYLENIQRLSERQEKICAQMEQESKEKCETLERETTEKCETLERETTEKCETLERETTEKCETLERETTERCETLERETTKKCETLERETTEKCEKLERETTEKCDIMEREITQKCETMLAEAQKGVDERWLEISQRLEAFYEAHRGLRELLTMVGGANLDK